MKTLFVGILLALSLSTTKVLAQDSMQFHGNARFQGMLQKGNLEQLSVSAGFLGDWQKKNRFITSLDYMFVDVQGFRVIDDIWNHGQYFHGPNKRIYATGTYYIGKALSFGIDRAVTAGVGGGIYLIKPGAKASINVNAMVGWSHLEFTQSGAESNPASLFIVRSNFMLGQRSMLNVEHHSYHGFEQNDPNGMRAVANLRTAIANNWFVMFGTNYLWSDRIDDGKKHSNFTQVVGLQKDF